MKILGFPLWLYLLFVSTLALGTDEFVLSGILPRVAADFSVTNGMAGLLITAFAISFCLGSPVVAFLTDRFEKKKVLVCSLLIFSLANLGVAWALTFEVALVMRIVAGISAAAISPLCMVIAASTAPSGEHGRYLSLATSGLTVALFTGVPAGAFLANIYNWRATFLLIAALSFIVASLIFFFCPVVPGNDRVSLSTRLSPFRNRSVCRLVIAMFLCGSGGLMFYNYLGTIILDYLGGSDRTVVVYLLIIGITGVVSVFAGGFSVDQFGSRFSRLLVVGGHSFALALIALYLFMSPQVGPLLLGLIVVWSIFAWALGPAMQASIMAVGGESAMLAMSLGISGLYAGSAFGAAIGGYLIENTGVVYLPALSALLLLVAFGLINFSEKKVNCRIEGV